MGEKTKVQKNRNKIGTKWEKKIRVQKNREKIEI